MYMYISISRCAFLFVVACIYIHRCMHSMIYEVMCSLPNADNTYPYPIGTHQNNKVEHF